jgi:hypothetical protein
MESTMEKQIVESGDSVYKVITLDDIIGKKENKKQEEKSPDKSTDSLVPLGMREIKLEDIETTKKVKYIENPLPVPKRREHKEMSYAINELTSENDDYDVKDMTGMDFFDIE